MKTIAIDGSRAFIKNRTGIEEYAYKVIEDLRGELTTEKVLLYIRRGQEVDLELPQNWKIKKLWFPRLWTQVRLSLSMLVRRPDVLFVPAHTVPIIHPKKTVVVIHGLEYEFCPEAYSAWQRFYMRRVIKNSCRWASDVICVSKNTLEDVVRLYGVKREKISVIYEGYNRKFQLPEFCEMKNPENSYENLDQYFLFIGRIEQRKNISNIIKAFEYEKEKYDLPHKLVLAGKPGYGYAQISQQIQQSKYKDQILELGFVSEEQKWKLLGCASVFLFPTWYEGFGIPILEAQSAMVPVIASNKASIPEIADGGAFLIEPENYQEMGEDLNILVRDADARERLIRIGYENVKKFSWAKCANEIAKLLRD